MKQIEEVIPAQHSGAESSTVYSVSTKTVEEAMQLFSRAKANLLNINNWKQLAGAGSASFQLTDDQGNQLPGPPEKGNYLKINIPAPGAAGSDGYDWVKIEEIEDGHTDRTKDWIIIRVRPAEQPQGQQHEATHFFSEDATSNFYVKREGNTLTAAVIGKNEKPNTKVSNPWSKIRNAITGLLGLLGFNKPQWKMLVKGILKK